MGAFFSIIPRDYQTRATHEARDLVRRGQTRVIVVMPTGAGKRCLAAGWIEKALSLGATCWFLVHRQELLDQTTEMLTSIGVLHGIIKAGVRDTLQAPCQVGSIQTVVRRLSTLSPPTLIIVDECHHSVSNTWRAVITAYPKAIVLGLSATPQRLDGKGLAALFDAMVVGPGLRELIDAGYLADYRLFAPPPPDLAGVGVVAGDYQHAQLAAVVDRPKIVGDLVAHYSRLAPGKQAICFGVSILHSMHIAEQFRAAGIPAVHADGETPKEERRQIMRDFVGRKHQILCNVELFGEGVDVAGIEAVILARPTRSLTLHLQQVGRGLRVKPGGERAILLDHAGNTARHGLPDDPREWVLTEDRIKQPKGRDIKTCPECFAVILQTAEVCPECGRAFEVAKPRRRNQVEGELVEITRRAVPALPAPVRQAEERAARDLAALEALGKARGYRFPRRWARHVLAGRGRRRVG